MGFAVGLSLVTAERLTSSPSRPGLADHLHSCSLSPPGETDFKAPVGKLDPDSLHQR